LLLTLSIAFSRGEYRMYFNINKIDCNMRTL
jgi:hypothetical protein